MILNSSPSIYVNGKMAERAYSNGELVWEKQSGDLPFGYKRCKYLESNLTKWQYIDTEYIGNSNTTFETEVDYEYSESVMFGGRDSANKRSAWVSLIYGGLQLGYGAIYVNVYTGPKVRFIKSQISSDRTQYIIFADGKEVYSFNYTPFENEHQSIWLYTANSAGTTVLKPSNIKLFYFKLFDVDSKVRDYIPCIDASGRPCMYDTITKQPFYNQGIGEFGYELMDGTYVAPV